MKYAILLLALATPATAQDYAVRSGDTILTRATLSDQIIDRDLEYFDGGISRYDADGSYAWTYADNNGGGVHTGIHDIRDDAIVCITYDAGPTRCDMFVQSNGRLTLLTDDGQRYPVRTIR